MRRAKGDNRLRVLGFFFGLLFCSGVFLDAFQTIILPRRPTGKLRITRLFYVATWAPWSRAAKAIANKRLREHFYSIYGPLSLLLLLVVWAVLLLVGYACFFFSMHSPFSATMGVDSDLAQFRTDLYVSGTTLFTLGLGDVVPHSIAARALVILEAGSGLGLVAAVIGYVPVLYQAFSRREVDIALLDGRAGSPPTSAELLRRHGFDGGVEVLVELLVEWERWSAEILESHISYPILCYYRSQHDNQNWLAAMTAVLDTCALLVAVIEGPASRQAQLTFAMARHALIDLGHVFGLEEAAKQWLSRGGTDRLPKEQYGKLCDTLGDVGIRLCGDEAASVRLNAMRVLYEPHACALADYLGLTLPGWVAEPNAKDQWVIINRLREQAEKEMRGEIRAAESLVDGVGEEVHEH